MGVLWVFFIAAAIADCSIDAGAQRCRNTYFQIDMQVQLCRGRQNQSMCRCSCAQISISQRGRTEETAHAFQSTEHLVHLFLSFHFGFLKNVEVNFRKLNILFPFARVASKSTKHRAQLFPSLHFKSKIFTKNLPTSCETTKNRNLGIVHSSSFTQKRFDSMR